MALVKWHRNEDNLPVFGRLWDDFFRDDELGFFGNTGIRRIPAVNVLEDAESFKIEVAAPGLSKKDFNINLENNLITISCDKETKNEERDERYTRREFCYTSFQRTFTLPESIEGDKISAKYEDGVLKVTLPKKEEAKQKPARKISIN